MLQEIVTWIIVAACLAIAVWRGIRWLRGKGMPCDCEDGSCKPSGDGCAGCPLSDLCDDNSDKKHREDEGKK